MKTIGLIGGMSWESSLEYYRIINKTVQEKLGGFHSARCVMVSVDFAEIETLQHHGEWEQAGQRMAEAALQVEHGGADFLLLCTNTMHKLAPNIEQAVHIPFLHIADATAKRIKAAGLVKIGLLGTLFTMEEDFYCGRLERKHQLSILIPPAPDREIVDHVIYDELCRGIIKPGSKANYVRIIHQLVAQGAQAVILGCTEIGLLVQQNDCTALLFDTTRIHAEEAVNFALI